MLQKLKFKPGFNKQDTESGAEGQWTDGDFVRLRDLTVNYTLPKSLLGNSGLDGVNVFVKGLNLFTWVKDDDLKIDPEVRMNGSWEIYTPILKSISVGANLKF